MGGLPLYYEVTGQKLAVTILEIHVVTSDHQWILFVNNCKLETAQPEDAIESNYKYIYQSVHLFFISSPLLNT